jgi:hypothetical protein
LKWERVEACFIRVTVALCHPIPNKSRHFLLLRAYKPIISHVSMKIGLFRGS